MDLVRNNFPLEYVLNDQETAQFCLFETKDAYSMIKHPLKSDLY